MSARQAVYAAIEAIAGRKGHSLALSDETALFDQGARLDSLDFAELVARLEDDLGVDPFAKTFAPQRVDTIRRLVDLYDQALS
jgi:acyl carrier protein